MAAGQQLQVKVERRPVTLHYPGAEGVEFHDAVLVMTNPADEAAGDVGLHLSVRQDGKTLMDGAVDLVALGVSSEIAAVSTRLGHGMWNGIRPPGILPWSRSISHRRELPGGGTRVCWLSSVGWFFQEAPCSPSNKR